MMVYLLAARTVGSANYFAYIGFCELRHNGVLRSCAKKWSIWGMRDNSLGWHHG